MSLTIETLLVFFVLALLAEIAGTVGGFGSSMFFVPIAGYFFDFHSVLGITAIFHLSSNLSKIYFFRKGFDKKLLIKLGIPAVIMVFIGARLSNYIDPVYLEISLSFFLIIMSLIFLIKPDLSLKPTDANAIGGGILSGFIAGILGTGGAVRGLTLAAFSLSSSVFVATSALIDLGIDATRSVVYFANGYMHKHDLYLVPVLIVAGILGTFIGKKILDRVTDGQFKTLVLILILATGIGTLTGIVLKQF